MFVEFLGGWDNSVSKFVCQFLGWWLCLLVGLSVLGVGGYVIAKYLYL